jgi:8-oxo-dGTP diphosphatase
MAGADQGVKVYLLRHADAGKRRHWDHDDPLRRLSQTGKMEAKIIAEDLSRLKVKRILSSPYIRCMETMDPLAEAIGRETIPEKALQEGAGPRRLWRLVRELEHTTVLCSHGDVITRFLRLLKGRGVTLDGPTAIPKSAYWRLTLQDGAVKKAKYVGPPDA